MKTNIGYTSKGGAVFLNCTAFFCSYCFTENDDLSSSLSGKRSLLRYIDAKTPRSIPHAAFEYTPTDKNGADEYSVKNILTPKFDAMKLTA